MKTINYFLIFSATVGLLAVSSCVSKGKYLASQGHVQRLQNDSLGTHNQLNDCNTQLTTCSGQVSNLNSQLDNCNSQVKQLQADKAGLQSQNSSIENDLQNVSTRSKMTIDEQAKRLKSLEDLIQSQKNIMNNLRKSIADALVNFKPDELSVYIKDGNVYVSLEEKLLFKSGSAVVDPKGKEALGTLAKVLNNTRDISVQIEGHTDTIPIKSEKFEDNWALSVGRATSIVRILTKDYGVDAHRITASGRGEFHPIRTNATSEGRASNRRTEIIISPNLSELYKLLGQ